MFAELNELRKKIMFLMDCEVTSEERIELRNKAVDLAIELAKAKVANDRKLEELQVKKVRLENAVEEISKIFKMAAEGNLF